MGRMLVAKVAIVSGIRRGDLGAWYKRSVPDVAARLIPGWLCGLENWDGGKVGREKQQLHKKLGEDEGEFLARRCGALRWGLGKDHGR